MAYRQNKKIPTWLIVVGFMMGFWPGMILLVIRLMQEGSEKEDRAAGRADRTWADDVRKAAGTQSRTYNARGQRTYQPPTQTRTSERVERRSYQPEKPAEKQAEGGVNADGSYRYVYKEAQSRPTQTDRAGSGRSYQPPRPAQAPSSSSAAASGSLLDHRKLSPKIGKGMRLAGNIILGGGAFVTAICFLAGMASGSSFFETAMICSMIALICCTPGLVLALSGGHRHSRVTRCRTYAVMMGDRRSISIDDLAAAIPVRYSKCVADLKWMLSENMLRGMYIDSNSRTLTYPGAAGTAQPPKKAEAPAPETDAAPDKVYPEESRIRRLNDRIEDPYVSQRMDRLEELTHKILAYAEAHPEKESALRRFRNHYLPKTFSILESYARMERTGVEGGNIRSAMKDVEAIMDKLVLGFENQLDALFDSEALDVTTDVSVLENMMTMEGLADLDPFGSLKKDDDLLTR